MSLTRGQIITEGLTLAGRTDLVSEARLWLNIFLEKMYRTQDWKWLLKSVNNAAVIHGGSVPTDYRAMRTARLAVSGVMSASELIECGPEEFDQSQASSTANGNPLKFYVDDTLGKFYFYPVPTANVTWSYRYYYIPTLPDPTDSTTDSQVPVWGEDPEILIQEIVHKAMKYNDDDRTDKERGLRDEMLHKAKINSMSKRAGHNKLKLGKNFRRRF